MSSRAEIIELIKKECLALIALANIPEKQEQFEKKYKKIQQLKRTIDKQEGQS